MSDVTFNVAMRIAKKKPLPLFPPGYFPSNAPFPIVSISADYRNNGRRRALARGGDTVEGWGLHGFVWTINESMRRFFPSYRPERVETIYLELWQRAAVDYLGVRPLFFRDRPRGLAIDAAIAHFLEHTDWMALPHTSGTPLPKSAEPLRIGSRVRRPLGQVATRVESAWGDLYLVANRPAFFRPAF